MAWHIARVRCGLLIHIGMAGVIYGNNIRKAKLLVVLALAGVVLAFTPFSIGIPLFRLIVLAIFTIGAISNMRFNEKVVGQTRDMGTV